MSETINIWKPLYTVVINRDFDVKGRAVPLQQLSFLLYAVAPPAVHAIYHL